MNTKSNALAAAILAVLSNAASAQPSEPPSQYVSGPTSPLVATTDLSAAEKTAYANYEAVLQIAKSVVHAASCEEYVGTYKVTAKSDGAVSSGATNYVTVDSLAGTFTVHAALATNTSGYGQAVEVTETDGWFNSDQIDTEVSNYVFDLAYNADKNMMDGKAQLDVTGWNGNDDTYEAWVIKDFYRGSLNKKDASGNVNPEYFTIYDWGLQAIDKLGFPVNKWWQESKSTRSDGRVGHTRFVVDRLVGASECRITIDTRGTNNANNFIQTGTLTIETGLSPTSHDWTTNW